MERINKEEIKIAITVITNALHAFSIKPQVGVAAFFAIIESLRDKGMVIKFIDGDPRGEEEA